MIPNLSAYGGALTLPDGTPLDTGAILQGIESLSPNYAMTADYTTPTGSGSASPAAASYVVNPQNNLVGATDIFNGTTYAAPLSTPGKTRVGYSDMLQLNQTPGYVATNRPEQIGNLYLPFRPSGEGAQVANDIKT